jgi:hypothetical protein
MPAAAPAPEHAEPILAQIFHESLAATTDMAVLPGVLGCRILRRTVQVRKPTPCGCQVARPSDSRSLRSAQSRKRVPSFVVSRQQFMKYPGLIHRVRISNSMKSEIRISKSETNLNFRNINDQNARLNNWGLLCFENLRIRASDLFSASCFEFRILDTTLQLQILPNLSRETC